jgi:hypothetical protein
MTDLRALLPPPGRTNTTPLFNDHPDDHNHIVAAVNELADKVTDAIDIPNYRVYADKAARDADATAHVEGMLAWAVTERTLAIWHGAWNVVREPPLDTWAPVIKLGAEVLTVITGADYTHWYRHDFGVCTFGLYQVMAPPTGTNVADVLTIDPPLVPTSEGGAGVGFVLTSEIPGAIGVGTVVDPTRMAILKPPTGLLTRGDLGTLGASNVEVFSTGQYATGAFEE